MKKFITSIFAMAFIATSLQAADIVVDSYGTGNYTTIQAAVNAANPGDRIFVVVHATPYTGNISIDKSIEILSQSEGQRFNYQGEISINASNALPANSTITIQNMNNLSGSIYSYYAGTGDRNQVNIVNCKFHQGSLSFDQIRWDVRIQNDSLMNGFITLRFGRVTGCYVNTSLLNNRSITVNSDVATDDYVYIVGNRILASNGSPLNLHGISWASNTQYFYFANNYISSTSIYPQLIYCSNSKTGSAKANLILNNSFNKPGSYSHNIQIVNSLSPISIKNNLFAGSSYYGIYGANAPLLTVSFNHFHTSTVSPLDLLINDGTNTISAQTINAEGMPTGLSSAINGGDPDASHTDLDGSINDAGCFGGSYSRANFLAPSTGARTAFVIAPRKVTIGEPIDIFVEGFDY